MNRFVDTNILARLMTGDAPEQAEKALIMVEQHGPGELIILDGALVELFFVLETSSLYGWNHQQIADQFTLVASAPQFVVSPQAWQALEVFVAQPKLDFMDCLLVVWSEHKTEKILTFDKDLLKIVAS